MKKMKNLSGRLIGGVLLAAGVAAVFFYRVEPPAAVEDVSVRPIKSVVAGAAPAMPQLYFPGTIEADTEVDLSFEVSGRLIEFPVRRGQQVEEGEVLGRLDAANYENQVKNAEADLERAKSSLERVERALESHAVSQEEASQARASVQKSEAQLAIARKALEDTVLRAKFAGWVSDTFADNFDTVAAGRPVLKLQDIRRLVISSSIPETYLRTSPAEVSKGLGFSVRFDTLEGQLFPAELKEVATVADPVTQTYRIRFGFDNSEKYVLLPGMSGTVVVDAAGGASPLAGGSGLAVPVDSVGYASDGGAFVWVLAAEEGGGGVFAAHQRAVVIGGRSGGDVEVVEGLEAGERIAAAGVMMLTEGRRVRLLKKESAPKAEMLP